MSCREQPETQRWELQDFDPEAWAVPITKPVQFIDQTPNIWWQKTPESQLDWINRTCRSFSIDRNNVRTNPITQAKRDHANPIATSFKSKSNWAPSRNTSSSSSRPTTSAQLSQSHKGNRDRPYPGISRHTQLTATTALGNVHVGKLPRTKEPPIPRNPAARGEKKENPLTTKSFWNQTQIASLRIEAERNQLSTERQF